MQTKLVFSIVVLCVQGVLAASTFAQERPGPPRYAIIDHMQLNDGSSETDYVELEKLHRRLHQRRVDGGVMEAWFMNRVKSRGSSQFVTARLYDSLSQYEEPLPHGEWREAFTDEERQIVWNTGKVRRMLSSDLLRIRSTALAKRKPTETQTQLNEDSQPFVFVDYFRSAPGKRRDYIRMETDLFQKIHQARIDAGDMVGWYFLSREFPSGDEADWDFMTINVYPSREAARKPHGDGFLKSVLTDEERDGFPDVDSLRSLVRGEVWENLLRTRPKSATDES